MRGNHIADLFSCVGCAILSYNREKTTACVFVVVLLAVDQREAPSVIFHDGFRVFAAFDNTEKKLFVGITSVEKTIYTHRLW